MRNLITSAVFSPDGQRVVTASADHTARVWDARTGQPLTPPLEHEEEVREAAFAADGRLVVTAAADRTARVWDAATGEPVSPPLKHHPKLTGVFVGLDSRGFLTTTAEPWSLVWTLPEDTRSVNEHLRRAQLLAGRQVDDTGGLTFLTADAMARLWQELTAADRGEADATVQQVSGWQQYWTDTLRRQEFFRLKRSAAGHARNNELNEALEEFNKVIADNPDDYESYELRSEVHLRRREAVEAEADLKRTIELNPYFEEGYFRLVFLYLDRNPVHSHERALEAALKMAALNHSQTAFSMLGQAYYRAGRYQEAITTLNNDLKVDIEELKVVDSLFLAMSHQRLGDPSKAEQSYEKARQWRQSKKDSDIATNGRERFDQCLAETEKVLGKPASRPRATNPPAK